MSIVQKFKSTAFCLPAINNALLLANPSNQPWYTCNDVQVRYLGEYGKSSSDIDSLTPYLKGKVTQSSTELNTWFAEHGWNMNVNIPPGALGIGSIFDLLVNWLIPGEKKGNSIAVRLGDSTIFYKGVEMKPSQALRAYKLAGYEYPMFELDTVEGWKVFLVEAEIACEPFELPSVAKNLLDKNRTRYDFENLRFPFVEFEADVDISWVEQLATKDFYIEQAKKKVKLRLDDKGARAQSAVVLTMRAISVPSVYMIDKPFFVIFWREGLEFPAFVALTGPDSWVK